ncbi:MAG: diadenylate cyclase [Deltaproteobacteria bacterium]|jgi:diadenylate cyclase
MSLFAIVSNFRIQDGLDILFLTVVAYYLFLWFQGTKAFKAIIGLLVLGAIFTVAKTWGLFLTTWVFQFMWQILIILIVVLFQSEIRQVLEKVNPLQRLGLRRLAAPGGWVSGFANGIFALAKEKTGALVVIRRGDKVDEHITEGQRLEADPTPETLKSIFQKQSPFHDGAVLLKDGQIVEVSCYLPLSPDEGLPKEWGTRHRAALGLSERCDAWVVIVSEERGEVSLARGGEIHRVETADDLFARVREAMAPAGPVHEGWTEKIRFHLTHRWRTKLITFCVVCLLWLILAGQQNFQVSFKIPIEIKHLPRQMEIVEPLDPEVKITVRGLRKDASTLHRENIFAEINASFAHPGEMMFPITRNMIRLPDGRVQLMDIEPPQITLTFKEKEKKARDRRKETP